MGLFALASYSPNYGSEQQPTWPTWLALGGALASAVGRRSAEEDHLHGLRFGRGDGVRHRCSLAERFQDSIILPLAFIMLGVVLMAVAAFVAARRQRKLAAARRPRQSRNQRSPPYSRSPPSRLGSSRSSRRSSATSAAHSRWVAASRSIVVFADEIGMFGQIARLCGRGVAGLVGGFMIGRIDDKGAKRLEQFLLAVGVAGVGAMAGLAAYRIVCRGLLGVDGILASSTAVDWGLFVGSTRRGRRRRRACGGCRRTWLQEIAFGVSVALACRHGRSAIPQAEGPDWVVGLVLAGARRGVGRCWAIGARSSRSTPRSRSGRSV